MNNQAETNGGVINGQYSGQINISQTTFYGNSAAAGGVLYGRAIRVCVNDSSPKAYRYANLCKNG